MILQKKAPEEEMLKKQYRPEFESLKVMDTIESHKPPSTELPFAKDISLLFNSLILLENATRYNETL